MSSDGWVQKEKGRLFAKVMLPLMLSTAITGCKQDFTPDNEVVVDTGTPPVVVELSDPARDGKALEFLDRGLVVMPTADGNVLSWRFLGSDSQKVSFKIYKNDELLTTNYVIDRTFYEDKTGLATDSYQVKAFVSEQEVGASKKRSAWTNSYLSIALNKPENGFVEGSEYSYSANDASAADLDGDGQYELLVKWYPSNAKDNAQSGATGDTLIDAYTMEGKQLWRINLGPNIRSGAHYTQFMAFDFDQDGRAEIAMKTADGTIDGRGTVIGDPTAIYRNASGYILDGPEFLTMFDGLSGEALDTINYEPARGNVGDWGDTYGNRVDRFLAGVAYLGDDSPSLLMSRGYYTRAVVAAYDWRDNKFVSRWTFDTNFGAADAIVAGQGAHSLTIGDVDADGFDEIIFGAAAIDNDGTALYSTDLGHGDALHMSDIDPSRPGLEVFMVHESPTSYTKDGIEYGVELHDAETGAILWRRPSDGADVGRGVSVDIDPNYSGNENWGSRGGLVAADGTVILEGHTERPAQMNFAIWWDGDLLRELLDGTNIYKWNPQTSRSEVIFEGSAFNAVSNNGTKATPSLSADLFGDWREEVVFANTDSTELMIFSTTIPTDIRLPTLMHDVQYREAIAWQNVAYNQPPHPSFYLGSDTDTALTSIREWPQFTMQTVELGELTKLVAQGDEDSVSINVYLNNVDADSIEIFRNTTDSVAGRVSVGLLPQGQTTFDDDTALPDVTYYYWAVLKDSSGAEISELALSKTKLTSSLIPLVVFNGVSSPDGVTLEWSTKNVDANTITIYRADAVDGNTPPDSATRVSVGSPAVSTSSWLDPSTVPGGKYFYWIEFEVSGSDPISADPVFGEHIIVPVTNLTSTYTDAGIALSWDLQNFPVIVGSQLYRNTLPQAGGRTRLTILPDTDVLQGTFLDTTAEPGVTYWYMFKLTLADGSTPSTDVEGEITNAANITNMNVQSDGQQVDITWNLQNFGQEIDYIELYRNTIAGTANRVRVASSVPVAGSYTDTTGLVDGTTYWYMFKVRLADGTTVNTDAEGETLFAVPIPKANLFSVLSDGGISLSWKLENFFTSISGIELYRNTTNALDGRERIASGVDAEGVYQDTTGLVEDTTYWYMFKVTMSDGTVINTDPEAEVKFEAAPVVTSLLLEEDQVGFCKVDGAVENNNPGFTGTGFSNTANELDKGVYWKVNVLEAGSYTFTFVYANGGTDNRWGRLDINGTEAVAKVDMNPGDWTTYVPVTVTVELQTGEADIALISRTAGGLANVDSLTIESTSGGNAPLPIACQ
ncbi:rhamnogalacturonan lyase family protein [Flavobacterium sp. W21_SRS_FM6]|uniref:rhamnogalacturonan lyase family protein n=1 Tax=Flavobacterium sp. W21_SRS_FM6 TaxID=3240268 RepID=UPI003F8F0B1A